MNEIVELAKEPWTGGHLTTLGFHLSVLFCFAILMLALSKAKHPKVSHFCGWFLLFLLIQGLVASLAAALDSSFFMKRPRYYSWMVVLLQEGLLLYFLISYVIQYKRKFGAGVVGSDLRGVPPSKDEPSSPVE